MNKSIRDGFGEALVELGNNNPDVVVLTADLEIQPVLKTLRKNFPRDFFKLE